MTIKYQAAVCLFRPYYGLGRWSRRASILMLLMHYKICSSGNCLEKLNDDRGKKPPQNNILGRSPKNKTHHRMYLPSCDNTQPFLWNSLLR